MPVVEILAVVLFGAMMLLFFEVFGIGRRRKLAANEVEAEGAPRKATWQENIRIDLAEAGIENLSVKQFLLYSFAMGGIACLVFAVVFGMWIIGVVSGIALGFFGLRIFYVGRLAAKRHKAINENVASAARAIASMIKSNTEPQRALEIYARRADPRSLGRDLTGDRDEVAVVLARAIRLAEMQAISRAGALTRSANELGNQYLIQMIEIFNQNSPISFEQTADGLSKYATEIDYNIKLQDEKRTAVTQPLASYMIVGFIAFGLTFLVGAMVGTDGNFFVTEIGQITLLIMLSFWSVGYYLQRRKMSDR